MKKLLFVLSLSLLVGIEGGFAAKSAQDVAKKEIRDNADKDSRQSAKSLIKEGWKSMPGRLTLEKQIENSKIAEVKLTADGTKAYVIGTHRAVGGNYSAAKNIALVRAKGEIAAQLKSELKSMVNDKNSNSVVSEDEIALVDETLSVILSKSDVNMVGLTNILEIYRDMDGGKCEVMISMSIDLEASAKKALADLSRQLAGKTDLLLK
ncbi:MAG: hypothetical protein SNH88_02820 [Rikenellaceae bacterium]